MAAQTGSAHRHVLLSFPVHALKLSDSPLTSLSFAPFVLSEALTHRPCWDPPACAPAALLPA